jgi:Fe-S-cluster formation regulator IscX/YfhJ
MFKRRPRWIDQFASTLSSFGVDADPDQIVELAEVVYELHSDLDPAAVARSELHKWPLPQDLSTRRDHDRWQAAS